MRPQYKIERAPTAGFEIYDLREGRGYSHGSSRARIGWCRDDQLEVFERAFAALEREISAEERDKAYREALAKAKESSCS